MKDFTDILHIPVFVTSIGSKTDRWSIIKNRLDDQGFMNYQLWQMPDGRNFDSISNAWEFLNLDIPLQNWAFDWSGTLAGTIGYLGILKHAIDKKIPYFAIFEDDIQFLPNFLDRGNYFFTGTQNHDPNWHLIYLGSQPEYKPSEDITNGMVYGGYSILYSLEGCKVVYEKILSNLQKNWLDCFDMMMYYFQQDSFNGNGNLRHYVWSTRWKDYEKTNPDVWGNGYWDNTTDPFGWSWKNDGIVFPDYNIVSTLDCECIDPRKRDTRQEIKSKYCNHSKEHLINLKKNAGFQIFT